MPADEVLICVGLSVLQGCPTDACPYLSIIITSACLNCSEYGVEFGVKGSAEGVELATATLTLSGMETKVFEMPQPTLQA